MPLRTFNFFATISFFCEALQRAEEAARGGTRHARTTRDLAQRQLGVVGVERADDREPAHEGLHDLAGAVAVVLRRGGERFGVGHRLTLSIRR